MFRCRKQNWRSIAAGLVVVLGLMVSATTPFIQAHTNPNPGVVPPNSKVHGKSYGDWSANWWQWALSFPFADVPYLNAGGPVDISAGQSGHVWFLAGVNNGQPTTRTGTVPPDTFLFFPLANLINDYPCPPEFAFEPEPGESVEHFLQRTGNDFMPPLTDLFAEIDGVNVRHLARYRVTSDLFKFKADPALTAFDPCITGTRQRGVSVGYWLLLEPLPSGRHTLHFGAPTWGQDITYHLNVRNKK